MPTSGSSEPESCARCDRVIPVAHYRYQAAIIPSKAFELGKKRGFGPAGGGWYWGTVCTPCHVALRSVCGVLYLREDTL